MEDVNKAIDDAMSAAGVEGGIDKVSIIGHGDENGISLGDVSVDSGSDNLTAFASKMKDITTNDAEFGIYACRAGAGFFLNDLADAMGGARAVGGYRQYLGISNEASESGREYWNSPERIRDDAKVPKDAVFSKGPWKSFQVNAKANVSILDSSHVPVGN